MDKKDLKNKVLMAAAVAGLMAGSALVSVDTAMAKDHGKADKSHAGKGKQKSQEARTSAKGKKEGHGKCGDGKDSGAKCGDEGKDSDAKCADGSCADESDE